jgi:hypothetical protein
MLLGIYWRSIPGQRLFLLCRNAEIQDPIARAVLNPIERVWKLTRRMATHNQYFPTLASVPVAVENVFDQWRTGNPALNRLCAL